MACSGMMVGLAIAVAACAGSVPVAALAQQYQTRGYTVSPSEPSRNEMFDDRFDPKIPTFSLPTPSVTPAPTVRAPAPTAPAIPSDTARAPDPRYSTGDTTSSYSTSRGVTTGDTTSSYSTNQPPNPLIR